MRTTKIIVTCDHCGDICHEGAWWSTIIRHCDALDIHKADLCQRCSDAVVIAASPREMPLETPAQASRTKNELVWGRREGERCAVCGGCVYGYVWWTKNPDHYDDAKPIHPGDCTAKWMGA